MITNSIQAAKKHIVEHADIMQENGTTRKEIMRMLERLNAALGKKVQVAILLRQRTSDMDRQSAIFSMYRDRVLSARDVRYYADIDHWEFDDFLAEHPEFQRSSVESE